MQRCVEFWLKQISKENSEYGMLLMVLVFEPCKTFEVFIDFVFRDNMTDELYKILKRT